MKKRMSFFAVAFPGEENTVVAAYITHDGTVVEVFYTYDGELYDVIVR